MWHGYSCTQLFVHGVSHALCPYVACIAVEPFSRSAACIAVLLVYVANSYVFI